MKALVTGGTGFLGAALSRRLVADGAEVRVLTRRSTDLSGAEVLLADLSDRSALEAACLGCDVVFHTAARVGLWGKRDEFFQTNLDGTNNIIEACRKAGVHALVFTSSPSVVYDSSDLIKASESAPYPNRFLAHYPASKAAAEQSVLRSHDPNGLRALALRPHLIWGPGDRHIVPGILERGRSGTFTLIGSGETLADFTYIDNVVAAHIAAARALLADARAGGRPYFIGQDEPITFKHFVARVLGCAGIEPKFKTIPTPIAYLLGCAFETAYTVFPLAGEPKLTRFLVGQMSTTHYFDISRARTFLDYRPEVTMEQGFAALKSSLL